MKKNQKNYSLLSDSLSSPFVTCQTPDTTEALKPLILSSPHSGRTYAPDFLEMTHLPIDDLFRMEDRFVDDLIKDTTKYGIPLLHALFPRSFCDVNRDWKELDASMFKPPLNDTSLLITSKVQAGYGVIPRCTSPGRSLYRYCLPAEEAHHRIQQYWIPYHHALHTMQEKMVEIFGFSVLCDVHSMPPLAQQRPCDIVLSDQHGHTCSALLMDFIEEHFKKMGYHTQRNTPYAGGYITQTYGSPERHRHALQIEINRTLYLNMNTLRPNKHFNRLQKDLLSLFNNISNWLYCDGRHILIQ